VLVLSILSREVGAAGRGTILMKKRSRRERFQENLELESPVLLYFYVALVGEGIAPSSVKKVSMGWAGRKKNEHLCL